MDAREQMPAEEQERIYQNALLLIDGDLYAEAADELARIPEYRDAAQKRSAWTRYTRKPTRPPPI